ncbi:GNAT family N-acetyltransferase [Stappia sp. TSB10P1A]|uniref:GNAT family N-acetyltransferase n=1 Tax=Stappia sp. TSB10P1A TaxID=2003585 RepID=UPI001643A3DA|nr:GNAT family N-acetyltransferase [Stappia sp. TSB10P1A]
MTALFDHHGGQGPDGAAVAAPKGPTPRLPLSTVSVRNRHANIELSSARPMSDAEALRLTAASLDLFNEVLASDAGRAMLFRFEPRDLIERDAHVVCARDGTRVVGTMHFHRDDRDRLVLRGAVVHPDYAGLKIASAMGALGMLHDFVANGEVREICLAVRQTGSGRLNEASRISFSRLGFLLETQAGRTALTGTFRDRHLLNSSEQDADGVPFIRYRQMTAGPEILPRARAFLAAWSEAVLPVTGGRRS